MTLISLIKIIIYVIAIRIFAVPAMALGCTWLSIYTNPSHDNSDILIKQLMAFKLSGSQPSGWGYVGYSRPDGKQIVKYRSKMSSALDPVFNARLSELMKNQPRIVVMHNWLYVTGPKGIANPYPHLRYKRGKWYSLGDNGVTDIPELYNALKRNYLKANPITYGEGLENYQMGELWLLLILQEIENNNGNSEIGFIAAIKKMGKFINASLVFSDGTRIYCYTDNRSLYYYYSREKSYTMVSSGARAGDDVDWQLINGGQKVLITMDHEKPKIKPIDAYK